MTYQRDPESQKMPIYSDSLKSLPSGNSEASISIELRLDDVNVAGHVGNTSLLRVIDEARSRFLGYSALGRASHSEGLLEGLGQTVRKVIAQQTIEYRKEVWYSHHPVIANMWISHVGTSSFALASANTVGGTGRSPLANRCINQRTAQ